MTPLVTQLLGQSASDFVNIVWPVVKGLPLIGGGQLQPVEASSDAEFAKTLDMLAGIDAWQVLSSPMAMRGLASRVQWGQAHNTFTVRAGVGRSFSGRSGMKEAALGSRVLNSSISAGVVQRHP